VRWKASQVSTVDDPVSDAPLSHQQVNEMPAPKMLARLLVLAAMIVAGLGMKPTLEPGPWQQSWLGHNGARYSQIARNYVRLGPLHLAGAPLLNAAQEPEPDVYANHPPGLSWLLAAGFALVGEGETTARGLAALATFLSLLFLAWLVSGESDPVTGGLAALLAAAMPMTMVYGAHVDPQGAPALAAGLAVLLAYRRGLAGRGYGWWLLASVVATAMDWWGFYACVGSAIHLVVTRRDQWRRALLLVSWTAFLFLGWVLWLANLPGATRGSLWSAATIRGPGVLLNDTPELGTAVAVWFASLWALMPGWPLWLLLAVLVCMLPRLRGPTQGLLGIPGLLALLLLPPLYHGALFPQGLLLHSYWLFGLPIGLAASLAFALRPLTLRHRGVSIALAAGAGLAALWVVPGAGLLPDPPSEVPAQVGALLGRVTSPGELILTNYDCNPLAPDAEGDAYVSRRLEVTYASDRRIRGLDPTFGSSDADAFREALRRCPEARWFLLMPFPEEPSEALQAALLEASDSEPLLVSEEPPVVLFDLGSR